MYLPADHGEDGDFDGEHVADEAGILDVFVQKGESVGSVHYMILI